MARRDRSHDESHRTYDRSFDEDEPATTPNDPTTDCPECDGRVVTSDVETVCTDCGLVVESDPVDPGPDWRGADDTDEVVRRAGAPRTEARHDDGLTTEIGHDQVDVSGRKRAQLARLRTQQDRTQLRSKRERNCATGLQEIRRITSQQGISTATRDRACRLFRRAQRDDELRGRAIETLAAGAVYAACRLRGEVRTVDEVAAPARCDTGKVRLGYQVLCRTYDLPVTPYPLDAWVARVASACELSPPARKRAQELAAVAREAEVTVGCQRNGVAAACVYRAAQAHPPERRQRDVAAAADTTVTTVRARRADLADALDEPSEQ